MKRRLVEYVLAPVATVAVICGLWAGGWAIKSDIEAHLETVQDHRAEAQP